NLIHIAMSPLTYMYKAHEASTMMDPMIGIRSIIQIMRDMMMAISGTMMSKPINEIAKMIKLKKNCALKNPRKTSVRRLFIKETFSAVSSVNKLYTFAFNKGISNMNRKSAIKYTRKLIKN